MNRRRVIELRLRKLIADAVTTRTGGGRRAACVSLSGCRSVSDSSGAGALPGFILPSTATASTGARRARSGAAAMRTARARRVLAVHSPGPEWLPIRVLAGLYLRDPDSDWPGEIKQDPPCAAAQTEARLRMLQLLDMPTLREM